MLIKNLTTKEEVNIDKDDLIEIYEPDKKHMCFGGAFETVFLRTVNSFEIVATKDYQP